MMKHLLAAILFLIAVPLYLNSCSLSVEDNGDREQVINALQTPNKLGVSGREFKTMDNPKGEGVFVYDPRTRFHGVERYLIWLVLEGNVFPLNGPSKMLTPSLKWPREADPAVWEKTGLDMYFAEEAIKIIFGPQ